MTAEAPTKRPGGPLSERLLRRGHVQCEKCGSIVRRTIVAQELHQKRCSK